MSNNIDTMTQQYLQIAGRPAETNTQQGKPTEASAPAASSAPKTDTVEVTDSARQLQALEERVAQVGDVDQNKVDEVRSRIESGAYEVSSTRVADKMLAMDRALPGEK